MFNDVQQTATGHSIVVRGLSVDFCYTHIADDVPEPGYLGDVKIVLTDGTIIDLERDLVSSEENGEIIATYSATVPIPVKDIDYIQIGKTIIPTSGLVR